jgi:hypothetical protein
MNDNIDYNAYPYKFLDTSVRNNNEARVRELRILTRCHNDGEMYKKGTVTPRTQKYKEGYCEECKLTEKEMRNIGKSQIFKMVNRETNQCKTCNKEMAILLNDVNEFGFDLTNSDAYDACHNKVKRQIDKRKKIRETMPNLLNVAVESRRATTGEALLRQVEEARERSVRLATQRAEDEEAERRRQVEEIAIQVEATGQANDEENLNQLFANFNLNDENTPDYNKQYDKYIIRKSDNKILLMTSVEGKDEVIRQREACIDDVGRCWNKKNKDKCFNYNSLKHDRNPKTGQCAKKKLTPDDMKPNDYDDLVDVMSQDPNSYLRTNEKVKTKINRSRSRRHSPQFSQQLSQEEIMRDAKIIQEEEEEIRHDGFELLKDLVDVISDYGVETKDDEPTTSQDIADKFKHYIEYLMTIQKESRDSKLYIKINDINMLYPNSPLIGSSSIGFLFESIFDYDNVQNKIGKDFEIWTRPKSGEVYDFEFSSEKAMNYVISQLKNQQEKNILNEKLNTWIKNKKPYNSLYVNLKVNKIDGDEDKNKDKNKGIASRVQLTNLYLTNTLENNAKFNVVAEINKIEEQKMQDYKNCETLEELYKRCVNDEKTEEEKKKNCGLLGEELSTCRKHPKYVKKIMETIAPKMYMILKMDYSFVYAGDDNYIKMGGNSTDPDYSGFTASYIDATFPYLNWDVDRLTLPKKANEFLKDVPPFKDVVDSIVRKERKPSIFVVLKPKNEKKLKPILEKYNKLIAPGPGGKGTGGRWLDAKAFEKRSSGLTIKDFTQTPVEDKMDDLTFPALIYDTTKDKETFRVFE